MDELFIYFLFFVVWVGAQVLGAIRKKKRQQALPPVDLEDETRMRSHEGPEMSLEDALREIRDTFQDKPRPPAPPPVPPSLPRPRPRQVMPREDEFQQAYRRQRKVEAHKQADADAKNPFAIRAPEEGITSAVVRERVFNPKALREALVLNEVLGPPLSKRQK